jgi:hypothetical protein
VPEAMVRRSASPISAVVRSSFEAERIAGTVPVRDGADHNEATPCRHGRHTTGLRRGSLSLVVPAWTSG